MQTLNLRSRLDGESTGYLLEYLAERLGLATGNVTLEARFENGRLVRTYMHRGPVGNRELEELASREAPPLGASAAETTDASPG